MEVKPGYKQTEVGVIPEEWSTIPIGEAGQVLGGRQRSPHALGDPCKYLRVANVFDGYLDVNDVLEMPFSAKEQERFNLKDGDILLNEGQSLDLVGRSAIYHGVPPNCCYQNTLIRFRANSSTCPEFAQLVFQRYLANGVFTGIALQTTSIAHLGTGRFAKLRMPLPPLPEQRAIARALSDVDALIGALDQLIAKKRDLKQAAMQQLLTGQTRLPGFDSEWEVKRFADVAFPRRDRVDPKMTGAHEFCIELEHIESASGALLGSTSTGDQSSLKSVFRIGDVLFGKLRAYLRKYWLATRSGVCSTEIWVFAPIDHLITTGYLFQLIKTDQFIEIASNAYGTHMPRSDWNVVKNHAIRLPSLPEQTAIAEVLSDMDAELAALTQRRDKTRAIKQGMMQELLTGRIRLV